MVKYMEAAMALNTSPVIGVKEGKICYANPAAKDTFGDKVKLGQYAIDLIPEQILFSGESNFASTVRYGDAIYAITAAPISDVLYFCMSPQQSLQTLWPLSSGLLAHLLSSLSVVGLSIDHIKQTLEDQGFTELSSVLASQRHSYYSVWRQIYNLDLLHKLHNNSAFVLLHFVDLVDFCRKIIDTSNFLSSDKQAKIQFSSAVEQLPLMINYDMIQHLLLNLLSNSLAHTPADGEIQVKVTQQVDYAVISVQDNGEGISPEKLQAIFTQIRLPLDANHPERAYSAGLGLFVANGIARLHGGTLVISSQPEHGTSVFISIPIRTQTELHSPVESLDDKMSLTPFLIQLADVLDLSRYGDNRLE